MAERQGVQLEDGRRGDLTVTAIRQGTAWRGRVVFRPDADEPAEVVDCPWTDTTAAAAEARATLLATVHFPHVWEPGDGGSQAA
jgi:hypothetical protein